MRHAYDSERNLMTKQKDNNMLVLAYKAVLLLWKKKNNKSEITKTLRDLSHCGRKDLLLNSKIHWMCWLVHNVKNVFFFFHTPKIFEM